MGTMIYKLTWFVSYTATTVITGY